MSDPLSVADLRPYLDEDGNILFRGMVGPREGGEEMVSIFYPIIVGDTVLLRGMGVDGVQYGWPYNHAGEVWGRTRYVEDGRDRASCHSVVDVTDTCTMLVHWELDNDRLFSINKGRMGNPWWCVDWHLHNVSLQEVVKAMSPAMYTRMKAGIPLTLTDTDPVGGCPCKWEYYETFPVSSLVTNSWYVPPDPPPTTVYLSASLRPIAGNYWQANLDFSCIGAFLTSYGQSVENDFYEYSGTFTEGRMEMNHPVTPESDGPMPVMFGRVSGGSGYTLDQYDGMGIPAVVIV